MKANIWRKTEGHKKNLQRVNQFHFFGTQQPSKWPLRWSGGIQSLKTNFVSGT